MVVDTVWNMPFLAEKFLARVRDGIKHVFDVTQASKVALTSGALKSNPDISYVRVKENIGEIPPEAFGESVSRISFAAPYSREIVFSDANFPYGLNPDCVIECPDGKMTAVGGRVGDDFAWDVVYPIPSQAGAFSWNKCRADVTTVVVPAEHASDNIDGGDYSSLEKISYANGATTVSPILPDSARHLSCIEIPSSVSSIPEAFFASSRFEELTTIIFLGRTISEVKAIGGYPWGVYSTSPIVFYCADGVVVPQDDFQCGYIVPFGSTEIKQDEFRDYKADFTELKVRYGYYKTEDELIRLFCEETGSVLGHKIIPSVEDGILYEEDKQRGIITSKLDPSNPQPVAIPPTVGHIGDYAFAMQPWFVLNKGPGYRISRLFIPYGVRTIGAYAFKSALSRRTTANAVTKQMAFRAVLNFPSVQSPIVKLLDGQRPFKLYESSQFPYIDPKASYPPLAGYFVKNTELKYVKPNEHYTDDLLGGCAFVCTKLNALDYTFKDDDGQNHSFVSTTYVRGELFGSSATTSGNSSFIVPNSVYEIGEGSFINVFPYVNGAKIPIGSRKTASVLHYIEVVSSYFKGGEPGKVYWDPDYNEWRTIGSTYVGPTFRWLPNGENVLEVIPSLHGNVYCEAEKLILSVRITDLPKGVFCNVDFWQKVDLSGSNVSRVDNFAMGFAHSNWKGALAKLPMLVKYEQPQIEKSPTESTALEGIVNRIPAGCKFSKYSFGYYSMNENAD